MFRERMFPLPTKVKLVLLLWVSLALVFPVASFGAEPARTRVALDTFRGGEEDYAKRAALEALSDLTFAALSSRVTDADWLERRQLEAATAEAGLARTGLLAPGTAVAGGRWLRAEMVVLGAWRPAASGGNELYLQVVETATADVLAQGAMPLTGEAAAWVQATAGPRFADGIVQLLKNAKARQRALGQRARLAIPFFQTKGSIRLNALGEKIRAACQAAGDASPDLRVLRFPEPATSRAEDELALVGLAEPSPAMLGLELADAWAWGHYDEIDGAGVPFPEVRVEVTFHVWRAGKWRHAAVTGQVAKLDDLARKVATRVLQLTRESGGDEQTMSREEIAKKLYASVEPWILDLLPIGSVVGNDKVALHRSLVRMLELTAFFDPANSLYSLEFVLERWRRDHENTEPSLQELLGVSDAWRAYHEAFGFEFRVPDQRRNGNFNYTDNRTRPRQPVATYLSFEAEVIHTLFFQTRTTEPEPTIPPPKVAEEWLARHQQELLRRLEFLRNSALPNYEGVTWLFHDFSDLGAAEYRLRVIEQAIPLLVGLRLADFEKREIHGAVAAALKETGDPRTAEQLLKFEKPVEGPRPPVRTLDEILAASSKKEERSEKLRNLTLPPAFPLAWQPQEISRSYSVNEVTALRVAGDALWIATGGLLRAPEGEAGSYPLVLWRRDLRTGMTTQVRQFGNQLRQVADVIGDGQGGVWTGFEGGGLWNGSQTGGALVEHRVAHGLGHPIAMSFAMGDRALWVGGGAEPKGVLSRFDLQKRAWSTYPLTFAVPGSEVAPPQIKNIAYSQGRVFAAGMHTYMDRYAAILDPATRQWRPWSGPDLGGEKNRGPNVTAAVGDAAGFWVGMEGGIFLVDPASGGTTDLQLPVAAADGMVTAMCKDGDWLWIATDIRKNDGTKGGRNSVAVHLFVMHQPTRTWVGGVTLPGNNYVEQVAVSSDKVWLAYHNDVDTDYYVSLKPVLEVPQVHR